MKNIQTAFAAKSDRNFRDELDAAVDAHVEIEGRVTREPKRPGEFSLEIRDGVYVHLVLPHASARLGTPQLDEGAFYRAEGTLKEFTGGQRIYWAIEGGYSSIQKLTNPLRVVSKTPGD